MRLYRSQISKVSHSPSSFYVRHSLRKTPAGAFRIRANFWRQYRRQPDESTRAVESPARVCIRCRPRLRAPGNASRRQGWDPRKFLSWMLHGQTRVNVVTIVAWAGVGKSTLVNHWLRRMATDHYRSAQLVFWLVLLQAGHQLRIMRALQPCAVTWNICTAMPVRTCS